jgi:hypothetical protein
MIFGLTAGLAYLPLADIPLDGAPERMSAEVVLAVCQLPLNFGKAFHL